MPLESIVSEIERPRFIALLGVVSTQKRFEWAIAQEPAVKELITALQSREAQAELVERLSALLASKPEEGYTHPLDIPIAVYLRALDIVAPRAATGVAQIAVSRPDLWWGRAIADRIVRSQPTGTKDVSKDAILTRERDARVRTSFTSGRLSLDTRVDLRGHGAIGATTANVVARATGHTPHVVVLRAGVIRIALRNSQA